MTKKEEEESEEKIAEMGLKAPYVCISSRDQEYLLNTMPGVDYSYHNYRNSDIGNCAKAVAYLSQNGIQTVRMGKFVGSKLPFDNCIDYSNEYYDEILDVALSRKCKFFVSDSNGINTLPYMMGTPVALKNLVPLNAPWWGEFPQGEKNLFIFKKYYNIDEKRYLSVREMLKLEEEIGEEEFNARTVEGMGIKLSDELCESWYEYYYKI